MLIAFDIPKEPGRAGTKSLVGQYVQISSPSAEQVEVPIVIRNNTVVLLTTDSNWFSRTPISPDASGSFSVSNAVPGLTVDASDNIFHITGVAGQPNIGSILTTTLGANASYLGLQHATQALDTAYRTDDKALFLAQPTASSTSGWQDGTNTVVCDFFGNVRPTDGTASQGAIDPAAVAA